MHAPSRPQVTTEWSLLFFVVLLTRRIHLETSGRSEPLDARRAVCLRDSATLRQGSTPGGLPSCGAHHLHHALPLLLPALQRRPA